jgi:hypothetical protein
MTNELGHKLARSVGDTTTLGAYRRGNRLPRMPGALIDVWVPCARGEVVTGVMSPHVFFLQTLGERSADSGSIHCPDCRADLAARRTSGTVGPPRSTVPAPPSAAAAAPF